MIIECPSCHFSREVPAASIVPGKKYKVTCPRCSGVFHFSLPAEGELPQKVRAEAASGSAPAEAAKAPASSPAPQQGASFARDNAQERAPNAPHLATEQEGDDPLPPGAQIPNLNKETPPAQKEDAPQEAPKDAPAPRRPSGFWEHWQTIREHVRAYDEEPGDDASRTDGRPEGAPWENPEYYGFWGSFSRTVLGVLFHPSDFFRHVRCSFSVIRPILFYVLMSIFQMLSSRLWTMNALRELSATATDPQKLAMAETLMEHMNLPLMLLVTPFFSIFQVVLLAGLYHLMFRMVQPDKADFSATLRVVCYSAAAMVFCIVPIAGSFIASIWFVVALFMGFKFALRLSWLRTLLALLPLYILELAILWQIPAFMAGMTGV